MDSTIQALCAAYCAQMDAHHPGTLTGLYLVGSIALGDYREGSSDVDFIAVLDRALHGNEIAALHDRLQAQFGRPHFDGIYVAAGALSQDPRTIAPGFSVVDGCERGPDREERHPVAWLTLARRGIAIRGPTPSGDWVWNDLAAAQQHAQENLRSYWTMQRDWHRRQLERSAGVSDDMLVWTVLGVGRLHAMIAAGLLLSKTQAGDYELKVFPAHHALVAEAMALRLGKPLATSFSTPAARSAAMADFLDVVIGDGLVRPL